MYRSLESLRLQRPFLFLFGGQVVAGARRFPHAEEFLCA